jgi:hypothetical protein
MGTSLSVTSNFTIPNYNNIVIGNGNSLVIEPGVTLTVPVNTMITIQNGGSLVNLSGNTLNISGEIIVDGELINEGTGRINITNNGVLRSTGTLTNNGIVNIAPGAILSLERVDMVGDWGFPSPPPAQGGRFGYRMSGAWYSVTNWGDDAGPTDDGLGTEWRVAVVRIFFQ